MSDSSQGPGWWQASDGKWYPPEQYPTDWDQPAADAAVESAVDETDGAVEDAVADGAPDVSPVEDAVADGAPDVSPVEDAVADGAPDVSPVEGAVADGAPGVSPVEGAVADGAPGVSPVEDAAPSAMETTAIDPDALRESLAADAPAVPDAPSVGPGVDPPPVDAGASYDPPVAPVVESPSTYEPPPPTPYGSPPAAPASPYDPAPPSYDAPSAGTAPTTATPQVGYEYDYEELPPQPRSSGGIGANMAAVVTAIIGGALLIVGSLLEWGSVSGTTIDGVARSGSVNGFDSNGAGTLICGLIVVAAALALAFGVRNVIIIVAIAGSALVALGLFVFSMIDFLGKEFVDTNGVPQPDLDLGPSIGLWVVLIGALVSGAAATLVKLNDR